MQRSEHKFETMAGVEVLIHPETPSTPDSKALAIKSKIFYHQLDFYLLFQICWTRLDSMSHSVSPTFTSISAKPMDKLRICTPLNWEELKAICAPTATSGN